MIGFRQWLLAVVSALLLHAVIILPFVANTPEPAQEHLAGGLEIGLGTGIDMGDGTGEFAADGEGGEEEREAGSSKENAMVEPLVAAPVPKAQPIKVARPDPVPEPAAERIAAQAMPVSANVMAVQQAISGPVDVNKAETPEPVYYNENTVPQEEGATASGNAPALAVGQNSASTGTGKPGAKSSGKSRGKPGSRYGDGKPGGNGMADSNGKGRARLLRGYFSDISALIDAHKDYPDEVKKKKHEGIVIVDFTISRSGELLSSAIRKSSGHPLLDQAALATLARSSPFPPIPDLLDRETLKIAVPIDYTLIQNQ